MSINRRRFIRIAIGLAAAPFVTRAAASSLAPFSPVSPSNSDDGNGAAASGGPPASPQALLAALSDPGAAGRLGQSYLVEHPQEQDLNRLIDQLLAALDADQGPVPTGEIALQKALIGLIQREYITAPLRSVDGWLLAPSEARLYALAALATTAQRLHQAAAKPSASCAETTICSARSQPMISV